MRVLRDTTDEVVVDVQWTLRGDDGAERPIRFSEAVDMFGAVEIAEDLEDFLRHELGNGYIHVPLDPKHPMHWVRLPSREMRPQ